MVAFEHEVNDIAVVCKQPNRMPHALEIVHLQTGDVAGFIELPLRVDGDQTSAWVIQQLVESVAGYTALVALVQLEEAMKWFHYTVFQTKHQTRDTITWKDIYHELEVFLQTLSDNETCVVLLSQ